MEKIEMLKNIKKLNIEFPFQEALLNMIEKNIHRIEFVNDHIGLRDFLFIAEKGTTYQDELFLTLDVDVDKDNTLEENEKKMYEKYENNPYAIYTFLQRFFKEEERLLTIGIGFAHTEPTQEETMSIEFAFQTGMIKSKVKAYRDLRIKKFPKWYRENSKLPEEILFFTKEEEEEHGFLDHEEKKEELMKKINQSLEQKNQEKFIEYAKAYKKLIKG